MPATVSKPILSYDEIWERLNRAPDVQIGYSSANEEQCRLIQKFMEKLREHKIFPSAFPVGSGDGGSYYTRPSIYIIRRDAETFEYGGLHPPCSTSPIDLMHEFISNPDPILKKIMMPKFRPCFTLGQMRQRTNARLGLHRTVAHLLAMDSDYVQKIINMGRQVLKLEDDAGERVAEQIEREYPETYGAALRRDYPDLIRN